MEIPLYSSIISDDRLSDRIRLLRSNGFLEVNSFGEHSDGVKKLTTHQILFGTDEWFMAYVIHKEPGSKGITGHPGTSGVMPGGLRYNTGKAQWALVDFPSLEPMVRVMEYGANKYAPHNWKKGMPHTQIAECAMRHLFAYLSGEDIDPESGQSHIAHVQANAMFLQYNIKNHPVLDDRYGKSIVDSQ